ncbi:MULTISPECIES: virB8 family protein [Hyphomicrobiales]|jgi:type IV secretion system protein VirB8|uniref:Type IV secretion system protein virB8 n=1 Tax=Brucella tritici TaxID=94626 RepID=A0A6L3Y8L2_9HYPH|nr:MULTISPECIES: VirB8/TrbF family protein [Hyphomicrobiales]KAB2680275.1 type VI secretion protein [Brucella tritici]MBA3038757.1 type VI secretion protein [Rhizobiaceae bacterium]MBN9136881.1 type VI secretion protein [Phyllobacterium sp.]MBN9217088.1 type VI secretion protein [Mesorhizobium sp.]
MTNEDAAAKTPETPPIDLTAYWKAGASWEAELYRKERRSRKIAWTVATVAGISTLLSLSALNLLVPLKQFEAVVVIADKTTGFVEVARSLNESKLSENDAIKTANIVRYIRARETYDPRALKDNFDLAQLYSTGQAATDLRHEFEPSNPQSKDKLLGRDTRIAVTIKSVSFLNASTATVRFSTETRRDNTLRREHWVSVVRFRYTTAPLKNEYRFDNPLGFQATEYRRDQESLPEVLPADKAVR